MIVLSALELCGGGWLATGVRHSKQRTGCARREQNRAVGLPCASARGGGIGEGLNGLAVDVETLQLLIGEEANRPTVRRPERKACAFSSCQQSARRRSQRSQPQRRGLLDAETRRHDDLLTIWRDRKLRGVSGHAAGKQDVESDFRWSRRLAEHWRHHCRGRGRQGGQQRPRRSLTSARDLRRCAVRLRSPRLRVVELDAHVADVSPAALRILFETTRENVPHGRRRRWRQRGPVGRSLKDRCDHV